MILYHASNVEVKMPMFVESNRMLDFGPGFYTTTNREQAMSTINELRVRKLYDQLVFASPKTFNCLTHVRTEVL